MIPTLISDSINSIISEASTPSALERRIILRLYSSTNKILRNLFGSEAFVIGAAFNKVLIPNECVEMTQLLFSKEFKHWSVETIQAISQEANLYSFALMEDIEHQPIENIQLSVNGNFIQCQQARVRFRQSLNNVHGLLLTAAVERFNHDLDLSKLLQHDALVVITMMLIASRKDVQQSEIDNPLAALHCFLETFSEMDWNSSHVTALGIVPVTSDTADLNPKSSRDSDKSSNNRKAMLEMIIDHYRILYSDNFEVSETHSSDGESDNNSRDGVSPVDYGRVSPARAPSSCADFVVVMNPFSPGRNLCSCSPSYYRLNNISDELRAVFRKGFSELSAGIQAPGGDTAPSSSTPDLFLATVFPWTCAMLQARRDEASAVDIPEAGDVQQVFNAICLNIGESVHSPERYQKPSISSELIFQQALHSVDTIISRAVKVSSKRVTEESILNLVVQSLHRYGPMPIGEIGKQLQVMAQNPDFPKLVKKRFGGLKKLISSHLELFNCGDNHTFNPIVYVIDHDKNRVKEPPAAPAPAHVKDAAAEVVEHALSLPMPSHPPSAPSSTTSGTSGGGHVRRNSSSSNLQQVHPRESSTAASTSSSSSSSTASQHAEEGPSKHPQQQQPQQQAVSADRNLTYTEYYAAPMMHAYPAQPHYQYHQPHQVYQPQQYPQTQQYHQQPYPGQVYPATGYVVVRQQPYPFWNVRPPGPGQGQGPGPSQGNFQR